VRDDDFGTTAVMEAWALGGYYAKDEADAIIAALEAELNNRVEESAHWHGIAKQAEAERDAARADAESARIRMQVAERIADDLTATINAARGRG
jgi:hypothetical protein